MHEDDVEITVSIEIGDGYRSGVFGSRGSNDRIRCERALAVIGVHSYSGAITALGNAYAGKGKERIPRESGEGGSHTDVTVTPRDYIQISIAIHVTYIKGLQPFLSIRDWQHRPVISSVISSPCDSMEVGAGGTNKIINDKVDISVAIHIRRDSAPRVHVFRQRDVVLGDIDDLGRGQTDAQNKSSNTYNDCVKRPCQRERKRSEHFINRCCFEYRQMPCVCNFFYRSVRQDGNPSRRFCGYPVEFPVT